jgi:tetratricopeptide (TPR) repeat protein
MTSRARRGGSPRAIPGGVLRILRVVVIALVCAWAGSSLAQTDGEIIARAAALMKEKRYAEAYKLLDPLEDRLAGDLTYDHLLAQAALESGDPSRASFVYERILAVDADQIRVRLEMGRAYLALKDYARAKLEFETVLRFSNLPPDLREQAVIYGKAAEDFLSGKRTVGFGYLEYGLGYDSNPKSAPSQNGFLLPGGGAIAPESARSTQFQALALGGEVIHALTDNFQVFAGGDARARFHRKLDTADFTSVDTRAGVAYNEGVNNIRVGVTFGRYFLDYTKTRDSLGLTTDYSRRVSDTSQLSVGVAATRFAFSPVLELNDFEMLQGTLAWLTTLSEGRGTAGVIGLAGREKATRGRDGGDKPFAGARLTFAHTLTDRLGAFVLAGAQRGRYKEADGLFQLRRADTLYDVTAGLTWTLAPGWSVRPQIAHYRNNSNIEIYEYRRNEAMVNVRLDF